MKKSVKPLMILFLAVLFIAVAIGVWFTLAARRRPEVQQADGDRPAMVEAYERLLAAYNGAAVDELEPPSLEPFPKDALDIIAGYERVFARMEEAGNASGVPDLQGLLGDEPGEWTDDEASTVKQSLDKNQELVREIREMAARGGPVYALDFSKGYDMELPHLAPSRSCARWLHADAVLSGMKGNYSVAADDIIAGMSLGDALSLEPVLISQLVRIAVCGIMESAVQNSFDGADLSPDLTRQLLAHIAGADNRHAFAESLRAERYIGTRVFSRVQEGDFSWIAGERDEEGGDGEAFGERLFWRALSTLGRPLLREDKDTYTAIMERLAGAAELPYYQAAPELDRMERDVENLPPTRILSRILLPALARACLAQARHEAMLDLMQIGILVEQYKARSGSFPAALDAITADLGGSVPVDPFTGEAYHYKPSRETFLLYSVGQNCVDDDGEHNWRTGDMVWRGREER